jgi:membrane protein required for colicin V production
LKGFVGEVFSMAAIILGILCALFFYKNGGEFLRTTFWPGLKVIPEVIAFISLFIIVFIVVKILESMFKGIIERVKLSGIDRFLGTILGLAEGIAVVSLVLLLLKIQPLFDPSSILSDSVFAKILLPLITGSQDVPDV